MSELPLRTLAPAKINLGLFLGGPRADGKHELATVMQAISLADQLTLEPASDEATGDEIICPGVERENLAGTALRLFREASGWDAPALRLSIVKRIPLAGGLGGGSADAAAALRLAARASGLGEASLLSELAARLGSDVPALVRPGRWLVSGAGERLTELADPNPPFGVLVLPSRLELSTAAVYEQADRMNLPRTDRDLADRHRELGSALAFGASAPPPELLENDLQRAAVKLCPEIERRLKLVDDAGADRTFLSGSGPTVVGLFLRANPLVRAERAREGLAQCEPAPLVCAPAGSKAGAIWPGSASQLDRT
jgi:4-diphosphocytidyl-2-C-methyl-D-erythritol kinase